MAETTLALQPVGDRFEEIDYRCDPHLQEEKLRYQDGASYNRAITREEAGKRWTHVLVRLKSLPETKDWPKDSSAYYPLDGLKIILPSYADDAADPYGDGFIVTGHVDLDQLSAVRRDENVLSLKAADDVHLHLYNSVPAIRCDRKSLDTAAREDGQRYKELDGSDVVIGIVDYGCDFRHMNFRHSSGTTRIRYFWDQTERSSPSTNHLLGDIPTPKEFNYGSEFTADMIDKALAAGDENAYTVLGYTPPIAAHGTHVMDIAAGNGREPNLFNGQPGDVPAEPSASGVAPGAQIIFVHLQTSHGGSLGNSCNLLDAVDYIFRRADELGLPAVVNLSLSSTGGPHDGTTLIERRFEAMVNAKRGRAIVTSAGNSYTLNSHISGAAGTKTTTILWKTDPRKIQPRDTNPASADPAKTDPRQARPAGIKNEMEIWYNGEQRLRVTLYPPGEEGTTNALGSVELGQTALLFDGGERVGRISHRQDDPNNHDNLIDIRLPHLGDDPWRIEITGQSPQWVPFDAWIEQSERGLAWFKGAVDPQKTLGSICCGNGTLTVGAFDTFEMASLAPPYEATSAGPIREAGQTRRGVRKKPELSAPGVNIVAARSQGGVTTLSGTSMAAPHVTGVIALLFQLAHISGRGLLSFTQTCDILTGGLQPLAAIKLKNPEDDNQDLQLGYGKINGCSSIANLLKKLPTAIVLDLKTAGPRKDSAPAITSYQNLFDYLKDNVTVAGHNGLETSSIISFLDQQAKTNDSFRLTIETLL
jgi:subtilisin family serine protease